MLQSIEKKFIIYVLILLFLSISKSFGINLNEFNPDKGVIALMYHRFDENKYPSTNIRKEIFLKHLEEINNSKIEFISFNKFNEIIKTKMEKNYLLLTIDDAFESFYSNAWPELNKRKIPFILFVSTREVGKYGYMTWKQIKEIKSSGLATIGNHSHSHEYLIDWKKKEIRSDLEKSIIELRDGIKDFHVILSLFRASSDCILYFSSIIFNLSYISNPNISDNIIVLIYTIILLLFDLCTNFNKLNFVEL